MSTSIIEILENNEKIRKFVNTVSDITRVSVDDIIVKMRELYEKHSDKDIMTFVKLVETDKGEYRLGFDVIAPNVYWYGLIRCVKRRSIFAAPNLPQFVNCNRVLSVVITGKNAEIIF